MTTNQMMRVARLHEAGGTMRMEEVAKPSPRDHDVLVRVRACGVVPNLRNIITHGPSWYPSRPLPPFPAIFGLDVTGEVVEIGSNVRDVKIGDRVYVNPGRSCGTCRHCRRGDSLSCGWYTFAGYFGFSNKSLEIFEQYPYGGFGEFMTAPATALATLPDDISFEQGARIGYIGTAYSALKKCHADAPSTILINGASGTLGVSCVLSALALGVNKILATGRNVSMLERVKALAPDRIEFFSLDQGSITEWAKRETGGEGVDSAIDCLGPGALQETFLEGFYSVRRGGKFVNIGATRSKVPMEVHYMMSNNISLLSSLWFTTQEAQELFAFAHAGLLDMSVFETRSYPLESVGEAIEGSQDRSNGGFSNFVVCP